MSQRTDFKLRYVYLLSYANIDYCRHCTLNFALLAQPEKISQVGNPILHKNISERQELIYMITWS